jgi:hypothetical protein
MAALSPDDEESGISSSTANSLGKWYPTMNLPDGATRTYPARDVAEAERSPNFRF